MASKEITLHVLPRGRPIKSLPTEICLPRASNGSELYEHLAKTAKTSVHRIRVTKGSDGSLVPNKSGVLIADTGLLGDSKIYVKDLGLQIGWRTVFIIEYMGPIFIHPLIYLLRPYLYRNPNSSSFPAPSPLQQLSLLLICLHFVKRELETLFVHRFSLATMPVRNIFKNSFHYWVLAGANIAYWVYSPAAPIQNTWEPLLVYLGLALFTFGELANANAHLVLRGLRSSGGKERGIPKGFGFGLVTCPNYMFETAAWIGMILVTRSLATVLFAAVSVGQMAVWAPKKERALRKDFGDKYKRKRYTMLPGIW